MKLFTCDCCGNQLYFENVTCVRCGAQLGFLADSMSLAAIALPEGYDCEFLQDQNRRLPYRQCGNYTQHGVCNWMVEDTSKETFCLACRLNRTIPNLEVKGNKTLWHRLEIEKRRLVFTLLRLGLPVFPRSSYSDGLIFDFLADPNPAFSDQERVLTGHDEGLITINIAEADPVAREKMRTAMDEHYRTILGHFRHESGHYYWGRLVRNTGWLGPYRELFGDERQDYSLALKQHYQKGLPSDWSERFVSAYAAAHPWEDWAETWAHYLHIVDTMETAYHFGIMVRSQVAKDGTGYAQLNFDPYHQDHFDTLIAHWLPISFALNSLNRSMGHEHIYPFVLSPHVLKKLDFAHHVIRDHQPA